MVNYRNYYRNRHRKYYGGDEEPLINPMDTESEKKPFESGESGESDLPPAPELPPKPDVDTNLDDLNMRNKSPLLSPEPSPGPSPEPGPVDTELGDKLDMDGKPSLPELISSLLPPSEPEPDYEPTPIDEQPLTQEPEPEFGLDEITEVPPKIESGLTPVELAGKAMETDEPLLPRDKDCLPCPPCIDAPRYYPEGKLERERVTKLVLPESIVSKFKNLTKRKKSKGKKKKSKLKDKFGQVKQKTKKKVSKEKQRAKDKLSRKKPKKKKNEKKKTRKKKTRQKEEVSIVNDITAAFS